MKAAGVQCINDNLIILVVVGILLTTTVGEIACQINNTTTSITGNHENHSKTLHRQKRLVFPKGSTFVLTLSVLQAIQINLPSNWFLDYEFDVIWPIPSTQDYHKKHYRNPAKLRRQHRRDLYGNIENALDSQNLPGRHCMLRAICEATTLLSAPGFSLIEDAIRLILSSEILEEADSYDIAYRDEKNCSTVYPCPVSLLQFMLFNLYTGIPHST